MNWRCVFFLPATVLILSWSTPILTASNTISLASTQFRFLPPALLWRDTTNLRNFLDNFGDINRTDDNGMTLMHYFAMDGLFPAVKLLQHLGAKDSIADKRGLLPVDYAKFGGHVETQQLLLGIEPPTVNLFTATARNAQRALQRLSSDPNTDINARTADGKTPLHLSAELGKLYATQYLIATGANLRAQDHEGNTPLDLAIASRHALVVSVLLEAIDINAKDDKGWTALNWAIASNSQPRVRELLDKGAKIGEGCQNAIEVCLLLDNMEMFNIVLERASDGIDAASSRGDTALMGVSRRGDEPIVDTLFAFQANPNVADKRRGYTPLRLAGENNHLTIVEKIIAHNAILDTVDNIGDTALIRTSFWGHAKVVQTLLTAGADPNIAGAGGMTALMWAIYWNEYETAKALLEGGADVNVLSNIGISPLGWAVRRSNVAMVKMILPYIKRDTYEGMVDLRLALQLAVRQDPLQAATGNKTELQTILQKYHNGAGTIDAALQPQIIRSRSSIIAEGVIIAAQDSIDKQARFAVGRKHADYPIHWLIANDKTEILERILAHPFDREKPFDLNASNADDFTPIMQALWVESTALEILLSHGADPNIVSKGGFPPIVAAALFGNKEATKILLAWRANPNATDKDGFTALMYASTRGYFELAELLLLEGADPNIVNKDGDDALALAEEKDYQDIAKILRQAKGVKQ